MSKSKISRRKGRDTSVITNTVSVLPLSLSPPRFRQLEIFPSLQEFEDRRLWHPEDPISPARSFTTSRHRLSLVDSPSRYQYSLKKNYRNLNQTKARISFVDPHRVLVCVRRKVRKEVMHALRHAGRSGQRKPRRNAYSSVSCRS